MKRINGQLRLLLTTAIIISVLVIGGGITSRSSSYVMGVEIISEEEIDSRIKGLRADNGYHDLLRFEDHIIPYDAETKTFYITQDVDDGSWRGILDTEIGKLYFLDSGFRYKKRDIISGNQRVKLYLVGDESYEVFDVCFTGLPVMNIYPGRDYISLLEKSRRQLVFKDSIGKTVKRGATSRHYEKLSYKLTLNDDIRMLGLREDDDWVLNALYDDTGLIHNAISYRVWNDIAAINSVKHDNTVNLDFVELVLDDRYMGVYALTERLDKKQLDLGDDKIMYKVLSWTSLDRSFEKCFELKWPDQETKYEEDKLRHFWDEFFVAEAGFEEKKSMLEYQNALDYDIFTMLAVAEDNRISNSHIIMERQPGEYKAIEIPWDCNATWGDDWEMKYDADRIKNTDSSSWVIQELYEEEPEQVSRDLSERWTYLRKTLITKEYLFGLADEYLDLLHQSGAYERNYDIWPSLTRFWDEGRTVPIEEEWKDDYIYEFIDGRIDFLDDYFLGPAE